MRGKSRSRSTSLAQLTRRCWICGNPGHYKKDCKSKELGTSKDSIVTQLTKRKLTEDEKGDMYLDLTSTQMKRESWLIDSAASFHMTPHRHWFCEHEELKFWYVLLGDDSPKRIFVLGKVVEVNLDSVMEKLNQSWSMLVWDHVLRTHGNIWWWSGCRC